MSHHIGNLPDHLRTHTSTIFLVALCKKKDFNHESLYGYIIEKLKPLESTGIAIPGHGIVKAGLVFVVGDNLGSHELGGFNENFSKAQYFCRYCCISRKQFESTYGYFYKSEERRAENYEAAIGQTHINTKKGIRFDSAFNALESFHVCEGGVPPCFGHDILEGFAAYDVALIIHFLDNKKWLTYEELQERTKSFNYSSIDKRDKPVEFLESYDRVRGGAWQIWTFIELLPLIMNNCINRNEPSWLLLLLLIEIIEILCSLTIHKDNLAYLHVLIVDYLKLRAELFPHVRLRPKHHYMLHYPELILTYGPLLKVWAMRFESKHSFFKNCIRSSTNFIKVLLSLSVRHELYQCFLRSGGDVRCEITIKKPVRFDLQLYSDSIQSAIAMSTLSLPVEHCASATVKGTVYKNGEAVVLRQEGYQCFVEVRRIRFLLYDNKEKLYVLVENLETDFVPHMRAYKLGSVLKYECLC
ncbi:Catalase-peroxidase [Frankliniella fusca]|uniref:Catalase-peroxidase n=1 Tax=Frankliniella fusca TaxID=407009 RepID=A0AAE1LHL6_9NEOP|nr:Catalase-peroxidase [Frankliniella fusca]